jgi:hypothetical protein
METTDVYGTLTRIPLPPEVVVELPDVEQGEVDQSEEWCTVWRGNVAERIRFHDYARIYQIPGLYEELFYQRLGCTSPQTVAGALASVMASEREHPSTLRALDFGAGNGMMGEALGRIGVRSALAVDLLPDAREACLRDRPGVYDDYVVSDFTALDPASRRRIEAYRPNALTAVAALGFGDIPSRAFAEAWSLISTPGWVAFNIKASFLDARYSYGFSLLIRRLVGTGLLKNATRTSYLHRRSLSGEPLYYVAIAGQKTGPIPDYWLPRRDS